MASGAQPIHAAPAEGQIIAHSGKRYTTVGEGRAFILVPESAKISKEGVASSDSAGPKAGEVQQVFYNPIQQFNRDLTVFAINAYGKKVTQTRQEAYEKKRENSANKKRKRGDEPDERTGKVGKAADAPVSKPEAAPEAPQQGDISMAGAGEESAITAQPEAATAEEVGREGAEAPGAQKEEGANGQSHQRGPKFTVLDALSATGLRALRYAHELPFVTQVTANDLLPKAAEAIKLNALHNGLQDKINVTQGDALAHMYSLIARELMHGDPKRPWKSEKYDVVDLDPYGTAATFLDAAVQAVRDDGGLLCVTCTDAGVWASNGYPEKAFALYGGVPIKGWHSHEVGLRLILNAVATSASRYGLAMEPLLSLSIDYYARVFVRIWRSPAKVKFQAGKTMVVYNCDSGCGAWKTQLMLRNKPTTNKRGSGIFYKHTFATAPSADQHCEHCGFKMHLAGPMYAGRLHSPEFVQSILDELPEAPDDVYATKSRIRGMLTTALEEHLEAPPQTVPHSEEPLEEDPTAEVEPFPFFFGPQQIARALHCATPPENALRGALRHLGYRVTRSHCKPGSIKTDAPWSAIWHVMKEWVKQKAPVKMENIKPGTSAYGLLKLGEAGSESKAGDAAKEDEDAREVVFDEQLGREENKEKLVRYQMNPRKDWGPMNRARGK